MTQGAQPVIHGAEWTPSEALTFTQPLLIDAARAEVMRFFSERHEGTFSWQPISGIISMSMVNIPLMVRLGMHSASVLLMHSSEGLKRKTHTKFPPFWKKR